jgi:hypothetical protein
MITYQDDNPFGDQNRSSIGTFPGGGDDAISTHTSEFSFRSSHSTNIIPIAYIPPHSSSLSVDDAQGREAPRNSNSLLPRTRNSMISNIRSSIPTSMASRDSLTLTGAEIIELNSLPLPRGVLTPLDQRGVEREQPFIPHGTLSNNGAPIRPPRSPGLDLQLPKSSSSSSPPITSASASASSRFSSTGFPFSSSSPTSPTYAHHHHHLLSPTTNQQQQQQRANSFNESSHLSVISSRSGNSTMSYILDPPQIITPNTATTNANNLTASSSSLAASAGVKRVEFQQAKAHKLGSKTLTTTTTTNASTRLSPLSNNPFSDDNKASSSIDPGEETGNNSRPVSSMTSSSRWTSTSSLISSSELEEEEEEEEAVQFLQGQSITFISPSSSSSTTPATAVPLNRSNSTRTKNAATGTVGNSVWNNNGRGSSTLSVVSTDLPRSARSSLQASYSLDNNDAHGHQGQSHVADNRQSSWSTSSESNNNSVSQDMSRNSSSTTSTSHDSLLAGIPFMAPRRHSSSETETETEIGRGGERISTQLVPPPPPPIPRLTEESEQDPLPRPFLPFAGQSPSSSTNENGGMPRVQSEQFSVRSGFGSGLSQIPFQLGFPSGFGEEEEEEEEEDEGQRGSTGVERWSGVSEEENVDRSSTGQSINNTRPTSPPPPRREEEEDEDQSNPFGDVHATTTTTAAELVDQRFSMMDTLALNAALSKSLEDAED